MRFASAIILFSETKLNIRTLLGQICLSVFANIFTRHLNVVVFLFVAAISVLKVESQKCCRVARDSPPVLEEFIPLKKERGDQSEEEEEEEENDDDDDNECRDKRNWMSSVQLWNNNTTTATTNNNNPSDRKQLLHKLQTKVEIE